MLDLKNSEGLEQEFGYEDSGNNSDNNAGNDTGGTKLTVNYTLPQVINKFGGDNALEHSGEVHEEHSGEVYEGSSGEIDEDTKELTCTFTSSTKRATKTKTVVTTKRSPRTSKRKLASHVRRANKSSRKKTVVSIHTVIERTSTEEIATKVQVDPVAFKSEASISDPDIKNMSRDLIATLDHPRSSGSLRSMVDLLNKIVLESRYGDTMRYILHELDLGLDLLVEEHSLSVSRSDEPVLRKNPRKHKIFNHPPDKGFNLKDDKGSASEEFLSPSSLGLRHVWNIAAATSGSSKVPEIKLVDVFVPDRNNTSLRELLQLYQCPLIPNKLFSEMGINFLKDSRKRDVRRFTTRQYIQLDYEQFRKNYPRLFLSFKKAKDRTVVYTNVFKEQKTLFGMFCSRMVPSGTFEDAWRYFNKIEYQVPGITDVKSFQKKFQNIRESKCEKMRLNFKVAE